MRSLENKTADYFENWLVAARNSHRPFILFRPPEDQYLVCLTDSGERDTHDGPFEYWFAPFDQDRAVMKFKNPKGFRTYWTSFSEPKPFDAFQLDRSQGVKEKYIQRIQEIRTAIEGGEVSKVVLSRAISIPVQRDPWSVFVRLLYSYSHAYCYWWYHPDTGHWMGATPEVLLSAASGEVQIMSLAGTLPANLSSDADWSEKEIEEQRVVTRYIENLLGTIGGPVSMEGPVTIQAGNLLHLRTLLKARVEGNLNALLQGLHPTPAVCGFPREEAFRLIYELEHYDREYYTGYLGMMSKDPNVPTKLYVNLRCMKWSASEITVFAGGGITEGSDPEQEWQETVEKSRTLLDILDITVV